jgi:hypothetical protein
MSYKAIFALVTVYNWELEQIDIKTMFLYGDIQENIWIELPTSCSITGTVVGSHCVLFLLLDT